MVCLLPATSNKPIHSKPQLGFHGKDRRRQIHLKNAKCKSVGGSFKRFQLITLPVVLVYPFPTACSLKIRLQFFLVIRSILTANASNSFFQKLPNFAETFASITDGFNHTMNALFQTVCEFRQMWKVKCWSFLWKHPRKDFQWKSFNCGLWQQEFILKPKLHSWEMSRSNAWKLEKLNCSYPWLETKPP